MTAPALAALTTRDEFLDAIRTANILTQHQLTRTVAALPESAATSREIATALVNGGFLTRFQADRLLAGRTDGFHLGQYVIQEQIGRGAMGKVFRATHRTMNRSVAIKVLRTEVTRQAGAGDAIEREVRAAAQLVHPNIVTAYDANELGKRFYLVSEFVAGSSLEALVRERGPLPVMEACELARQIALALEFSHSRGMVHRDLRPKNLLVADSVVKVSDFGIAKLNPSEDRDYVAPEQSRHKDVVDTRSDLYSLGAVMYFLLAGSPPFSGGSNESKAHRHMWEAPERVERRRPDVNPEIAELVHHLLAKTPDARPATATEVVARLNAITGTPAPATVELFAPSESHPAVVSDSETCPWAEITVATAGLAEQETLSWDLSVPVAMRPRPSRFPTWLTGGLAAGIFLTCAIAIGVIVRAAGK